jgi:xanthine dehydrogenase accessory factor
MIVSPTKVAGTIGGGRLEWDAIARARELIASGQTRDLLTVALGPAIGQCCGGRVTLVFDTPDADALATMGREEAAARAAQPHVLIYGAGHVGRALAAALSPLPFHVMLADSRSDELARTHAPGVTLTRTDGLAEIAAGAPDGSAHVIMTHSHALDSLVAAAVMERDAFRYLGIIGSKTKRASFLSAFREMGFAEPMITRVVCPIGGSDVRDKRPEVIAALAAAEITRALL